MEILDALEQKVATLLKELASVKARNAELESKISGGFNAGQGNDNAARRIAELEQALERETKLREAVLKRVDALVQNLEEHTSAG